MFLILLLVSFLLAVTVSYVITRVFRKPITAILQRLITEEVYSAWTKYLTFAMYVVGISGGVRIWELEKYVTPRKEGEAILELTQNRWVLEVYGTIIGTLQSIAWMLLIFFLFALIAYVIVKGQEMKRQSKTM